MFIDVYKDNKGFVTNEVSTVKVSEANLNEDNRIKFVTDLAAVSRGKSESSNPPARYKSLLKEAAPTHIEYMFKKDKYIKSPSRPLEFLPVVLKYVYKHDVVYICDTSGDYLIEPYDDIGEIIYTLEEFSNHIGRHSHLQDGYIYTNMRTLINAGIPYSVIPYNTPEEIKDFVAIKARIPMFVWAQVPNTHTMISKEAETDRHKTKPLYWLPSDLRSKVYDYREKAEELEEYVRPIFEKITDEILGCNDIDQVPYLLTNGRVETGFSPTQSDVQDYLKEIGYPAEIYQRAMYYFKYKTVVMTGWNNDPKVWEHLFIERSVVPEINKNWTQPECKQFVSCMKEIVNKEF